MAVAGSVVARLYRFIISIVLASSRQHIIITNRKYTPVDRKTVHTDSSCLSYLQDFTLNLTTPRMLKPYFEI